MADVISCGRTEAEQIEWIRKYGSHGASPVVRAAALAAHGISKPKAGAEYCVIFGCYRPFNTPFYLRDCLRLLESLSIDYTYLEKEYCCGAPLAMPAVEDPVLGNTAAGREFVRMNFELARKKGASVLVYCCTGCVYAARETFGGVADSHVYILDLVLDRLEGRRLGVPPTRIGYFEGCHTFVRTAYPEASIDWGRYRRGLDSIAGLDVVDLRDGRCCKSSAKDIVENAAKRGLTKILGPCSGCYSSLNQQVKDGVRMITFPELLIQALDPKTAKMEE
jgi:Fe-S oxidoreductase